jgi:ankyrin repeat protein
VQDIQGKTPLECAAMLGPKEVVELLLHKGANEELCDKYGGIYGPYRDCRVVDYQ